MLCPAARPLSLPGWKAALSSARPRSRVICRMQRPPLGASRPGAESVPPRSAPHTARFRPAGGAAVGAGIGDPPVPNGERRIRDAEQRPWGAAARLRFALTVPWVG